MPTPSHDPEISPDPTGSDETLKPEETRWRFHEGDEIAPGRSVIKRLGGGLRYEAYLAWEDHLRSLVVIKVLRPGLVEDRRTLAGLRSEIELLERLNHPVIVRSFGADLDCVRPHVVLEHLEGPRLSTLRRKYGPLLPEQLVSLAIQLCGAIHYLAGEGVVHLDVKPSNVIMGGPARLIDLSVALTVEGCAQIRSPVGTDAYMAPEQAAPQNGVPISPPADVWGVGVTLYEALVGERPFSKGDRDSKTPTDRFPQLIERPRNLPAKVPASLGDPIMACLAPDPVDRPTAGQLADRLELVLDQLPRPQLSKLKPRIQR
ncbi:MAG: serine/threonine protein kinase [Actinomycetota bacterium]|nr:serine/threonine protein kinase [Actinomycetota bacterium]